MVSIPALLAVVALACDSASAAPVDANYIGSKYLALPVQASPGPVDVFDFQSGEKADPVSSQFNGLKYTVSFAIGNNYQPVSLHIDTGSGETWVNPNCSNIPSWQGMVKVGASETAQCNKEPKYNPDKSVSAKNLHASDKLEYGAGLGNVTFNYYTDDFRLGEKIIKKQKFGVANASYGFGNGILGLAPARKNESAVGLVESLKAQGVIKHAAFSLNLRAVGKQGGIVFGGMDAGKYRGVPINLPVTTNSWTVPMIKIGITLPNGTSTTYDKKTWNFGPDRSVRVLIDSGAPFTVLPTNLVLEIGLTYPHAMFDHDNLRFKVPCDAPQGSIDFTFANVGPGKKIRVPYSDFIYKSIEEKDDKDQPLCILGVMFGPDDFLVLGDSFLRAAYVVFDVDDKSIMISESADCGERIEAIEDTPTRYIRNGCK